MKQVGRVMMGIIAGASLICAVVYSANGTAKAHKRHGKAMTFRELMDDNRSAGMLAL